MTSYLAAAAITILTAAAGALLAIRARRRRNHRNVLDRLAPQHHAHDPGPEIADRIWAAIRTEHPHLPPRSTLSRHDTP